jgi:hypothetical protein
MIEQFETAYHAETLCRVTLTKPAKRLLGIAAERYRQVQWRPTQQTVCYLNTKKKKQYNEQPTHKLHIWFFANPQNANLKKPKEQFFASARNKSKFVDY